MSENNTKYARPELFIHTRVYIGHAKTDSQQKLPFVFGAITPFGKWPVGLLSANILFMSQPYSSS